MSLSVPFSLMLLQCTLRVCPESRRSPHLLCYSSVRAISSFPSSHWALLLLSRQRSDPFRAFTPSGHSSAKPVKGPPFPYVQACSGWGTRLDRLRLPTGASPELLTLSPSPSVLVTLTSKAPGTPCLRNFPLTVSSPWESLLLGHMHDGLSKSYIFPENLTLTTHFNIFISSRVLLSLQSR